MRVGIRIVKLGRGCKGWKVILLSVLSERT